jgi:hypothetical protein
MDAFVELFTGRFDEKKEDKKSIVKISFNPFFVVNFLLYHFSLNTF